MTRPLKILIAGHAGFVGGRLCRELDGRSDMHWTGVSRRTGYDLTDSAALDQIESHDVVLNLAGRVGVGGSWTDPADYFRDNLLSTLTVLDYARKHSARVVQMSSYVYGQPQYQPIDEQHPVSCANPYAESKFQSESLCRSYAESFGLSVSVLRPFNLYGPDQPPGFLMPTIIAAALAGETIEVDHLEPRRDYLWVDDLAKAIACILEQQKPGFNIYNLGVGKSHSTRQVIDVLLDICGPREVRCKGTPRTNELSECICDCSLFQKTFGWKPGVTLEQGIKTLVDAARG